METKGQRRSALPFVILILLVIAIGGRSLESGPATRPPSRSAAPASHLVTYSVIGTGGAREASLTLENEQGGTEQRDVRLPYSVSFQAAPGQWVYLSAQNLSQHGGVICEIEVDRAPWKRSESEGFASIASCSGSVGQ